jgi:hypothetical protein
MRRLTEQEIIVTWERGLRQHPLERALTLLAAALPAMARADLLNLSIGQRDAYLLLLRERTFGSQFVGFAECQSCQERLEFNFDIANVWVGTAPVESVGQTYQYHIEGYELQVRLPTNADLLAIAARRDLEAARAHLLQRCIIHVAFANNDVQTRALPASVVEALGEQLLALDPQAEVLIDLSCPKCNHSWSAVFDVVAFLWSELQTRAKRLLREVHTLAMAYGWSESEILALSSTRRQLYLEWCLNHDRPF